MKRDRLLPHLVIVGLISLAAYGIWFTAVERWRHRRGPWEVTFSTHSQGQPQLEIQQRDLGIRGVTVVFGEAPASHRLEPVTVVFDRPDRGAALPFGTVRFIDTTFLPGTVTLDCFGHEVELLPRVLKLDRVEQPWSTNRTYHLDR